MILYITIWFALLVLSIAYNKWHNSANIPYIIIYTILVFIAGGRGIDVGVDTYNYSNIFKWVGEDGYVIFVEPGWNLINMICYKLGIGFNGLLTVASALTLIPIFYIAKKEGYNPFFSIFTYVSMHIYTASFNLTRQYMALSFVCLGYYYFKEHKRWKTIISFTTAISLHTSSLLGLVALLVHKFIKINSANALVLLGASFAFGTVVNDNILSLFTFGIYDHFITDLQTYKANGMAALAMTVVMNLFAIFIINTLSIEKLNNFWMKIYVLSFLVLNATYNLHFGARIYVIFSISQIFALPFYMKYNLFKGKWIVNIMIVLYLLALFARMLLDDGNQVVEYESMFLRYLR